MKLSDLHTPLFYRYRRCRGHTRLSARLYRALNYLANRDAYRLMWRTGMSLEKAHREVEILKMGR